MGRRFLTAEDVRRLGGPTITVDADTVVTPQALAAAASMGVQIDSGSGSYAPPVPDRGPAAQRALQDHDDSLVVGGDHHLVHAVPVHVADLEVPQALVIARPAAGPQGHLQPLRGAGATNMRCQLIQRK